MSRSREDGSQLAEGSGSICYEMAMTRSPAQQSPWSPTPQQREAARLLATSATWQQTADRIGVRSLSTITNWMAVPEFQALIGDYAVRFDEYLEQEITGSLAEMFHLWRQYVRGEVNANDKRIGHIRPTIVKFVERFYDVADSPPVPNTAVQINVGSGAQPA